MALHPEYQRGTVADVETLPASLWQMLYRCNNLEILELGSRYFTRPFDVRPLATGRRWPRLKSLSFPRVRAFDSDALESFILSHSSLKDLSLPSDLESINLANSGITLESFSGTLLGALSIPEFSNLTTLRFCAEISTAPFIQYVLHVLKSCPSLVTLALWIDLSKRYAEAQETPAETDHIKVVRSILSSCRALLHFKLVCSTAGKDGFHMVGGVLCLHMPTAHPL